MCGARDLAHLLDHAQALRVKAVLVGDHHQLPAIAAGGLFQAAVNRLPAIEPTENRRQTHAWERDALDQLRHGDPGAAMDAYDTRNRLTDPNADRLRARLVHDWDHARRSGQSALMIAATRADVARPQRPRPPAASRRRHASLARPDRGRPRLPARRRGHGHEDRHRLGLLNGIRGTITAIDHDRRDIRITVDGSDREITLPDSCLDVGHLDFAYATTVHKGQGQTVDATFTLGSDVLYRELAYVALSRGRTASTLYSVSGDDLARALQRTREQDLALGWDR